MQLESFVVNGLFGRYDHVIRFPLREEDSQEPSLVLLYGKNGIGKTTILRMIYGMCRLEFLPFREVPFSKATLTFSEGSPITVRREQTGSSSTTEWFLRVSYGRQRARLHPTHSGPFSDKDKGAVESLRQSFLSKTDRVAIELVDTTRIETLLREHARRRIQASRFYALPDEDVPIRIVAPDDRYRVRYTGISEDRVQTLSERIISFVSNAQLDYKKFFSIRDPDLFERIIERLSEPVRQDWKPENIINRMETVKTIDAQSESYGLGREFWDFARLKSILTRKGKTKLETPERMVIVTYLEALESRAWQRRLLIDRLRTFEVVANGFLKDKSVTVHGVRGLEIRLSDGSALEEARLSSGEYHLLYLLVTALTAQRRGTVIAIDEPEISMHLEWQRKLVDGLLRCASLAQPQLLIATHSPDITASHRSSCVILK